MSRPTDDGRVLPSERRWYCSYCHTHYAEYVNGCPRCHMGEPGTATSVEAVLIVRANFANAAPVAPTEEQEPRP